MFGSIFKAISGVAVGSAEVIGAVVGVACDVTKLGVNATCSVVKIGDAVVRPVAKVASSVAKTTASLIVKRGDSGTRPALTQVKGWALRDIAN